jgi:HEAT repeat protein
MWICNVVSSVRRNVAIEVRQSIPRELSKREPGLRRAFVREVVSKLIADVPREEVCNALISDLLSDDVRVRENAAMSLGELSPANANTVEKLLLAMDDPSEAVCVAAEDSLLLLVQRDSFCRRLVEECAHKRGCTIARMAARCLERSRLAGQSETPGR